jgi:two-component system CheB/CheR fusion protein
LTSSGTPTDPPLAEGEAPAGGDARLLIERAFEVLRRNEAVRVESSHTHRRSREARERFERLRAGMVGDRQFRLAALNLIEDAAVARRNEEQAERNREHAEAAAQRSAERYRQLFESMNEGFAILDVIDAAPGPPRDAVVIECNPAFSQLVQARHCAGLLLGEIMPDALPGWLRQLDRVRHTGEAATFEAHLARPDAWVNVSLSRLGVEQPQRLAAVLSDITRRKAAEAALAASEARLRLIVENAREYAIFSMDPERRIESWNAGAEAILGWTETEVIGRSADLVFTDEDRRAGAPEREAESAIATGRASDERWHVRKDGSRFFGSGVMTAMLDGAGSVVGLLKIFRDQTPELHAKEAIEEHRRRLEQALAETERARAEAEAAMQAKDHFLAVLSHELRTPLTPILLVTEMLLERGDLAGDVRDALAMVRRNVAIEAQFVDDLLDVTRIAHGKLALARARVDLHEVVARAVEITRGDFAAKRQRVAVELGARRSGIEGDATRLQQAFRNLLKNAAQFTPDGGDDVVRSRDDAASIVVEVADSGIGIEAARLEAIFDPFVQADVSIAREYGGLGLGLAIARATVRGHGGELTAHSDGPGRGTTFRVVLTLAGPDGEAA